MITQTLKQARESLISLGAADFNDYADVLLAIDRAIEETDKGEPQFEDFIVWARGAGYDAAHTHDGVKWVCLNPMTADLWKTWKAAHGITEDQA